MNKYPEYGILCHVQTHFIRTHSHSRRWLWNVPCQQDTPTQTAVGHSALHSVSSTSAMLGLKMEKQNCAAIEYLNAASRLI